MTSNLKSVKVELDNKVIIEYNNNSDSICFRSIFTRIDPQGFKRNKEGY